MSSSLLIYVNEEDYRPRWGAQILNTLFEAGEIADRTRHRVCFTFNEGGHKYCVEPAKGRPLPPSREELERVRFGAASLANRTRTPVKFFLGEGPDSGRYYIVMPSSTAIESAPPLMFPAPTGRRRLRLLPWRRS